MEVGLDWSGNYSRFSYDESKRYFYMLKEQGVPVLDDEFNMLQEVTITFMRRLIIDMFGDGSPNDGFKIVGTSAINDFTTTGGDGTLDGAGHFYVGGYLLIQVADVAYSAQEITPAALTTPAADRVDEVYIDAYMTEIDGLEDANIVDPVLASETSRRLKLAYEVKVAEGSVTPSSYVDANNITHYTAYIATINRLAAVDTIDAGMVVDVRPNLGKSLSVHGQCRLENVNLGIYLLPYDGNLISINKKLYKIPVDGVAADPTGVLAGTVYYIYAYDNAGSLALELATTGHEMDAGTGIEIKLGDISRTLVGMVRPSSDGGLNIGCLNWYNREIKIVSTAPTSGVSTSSTLWVDLGFPLGVLTWGGKVIVTLMAIVSNDTAGARTYLSVDTYGDLTSDTVELFGARDNSVDENLNALFVSAGFSLPEGYALVTPIGKVTAGIGALEANSIYFSLEREG